jgi:nitroimidazol reductase NimA-like FMN-containing flavoprotein (pyridoxamine 5'-phosphate oxidase superfamily)
MSNAEVYAWLEELSNEECLTLLRDTDLGRIAFTVDEFPVVLPVNYRFADGAGSEWWLALRTRPGNVIDQAPMQVAFEIDGVDPISRRGWSVLVRGKLHHVDPAPGTRAIVDSEPWLDGDRDSWLLIQPVLVTGRRLHPTPVAWAFHSRAYL